VDFSNNSSTWLAADPSPTAATYLERKLKAAIEHLKVQILNCTFQALVSLIPFTILTVGSMVMIHLANAASDDGLNKISTLESKKNMLEEDQKLIFDHHVDEVVSE